MAGEFDPDQYAQKAADDALSDARIFGLDDEEIDGLRDALGRQQGKKLWARHLPAFQALCAAGTQWRRRLVFTAAGPLELVTGVDYAALKVALDILGIVLTPSSWAELMVLERAAAGAMNGEPPPFGWDG